MAPNDGGNLAWFELARPVDVPSGELTQLHLVPVGEQLNRAAVDGDQIVFTVAGWYEVLLTVEWDPRVTKGRRFSHTAIPDSHPLHSEAIEADVLAALSDGKQLLRGNTVFDPETSASSIALEVWQDSGGEVTVHQARLGIRPLSVGTTDRNRSLGTGVD
jgi:hypothetical protein